MLTKLVPGTDLRVSAISFGAGTSAGLMVGGERRDQLAAVTAAIELGINHFDTAPIYGHGASEVSLGWVLSQVSQEVLVTTKFNVLPEFLLAGDLGPGVLRSVQASLSRLRRDHIDMLLLHNSVGLGRELHLPPEQRSPHWEMYPMLGIGDYLGDGGVWQTLLELRERGLVRYFGLGGMNNDPRALRACLAAGAADIFQQNFNLLHPSAAWPRPATRPFPESGVAQRRAGSVDFSGVLDLAAGEGVGVSVISPLAAGVLTPEAFRGDPAPPVSGRAARFPEPGRFERETDRARPFEVIARDAGLGITELAYRYVLGGAGVSTVVGGFSTIDQIKDAALAAQQGSLPEPVLEQVAAAQRETVRR